jgi:DNA-binding response OmpR family regulator
MPALQHRALIISEHPGMRLLVRLNLSDLALELRETNTAKARDQVSWDLPHVVVVDLHPPLDRGLALCRELRGTPTTATIPAVLLIEGGDADLRGLAIEAGATICLEKPFRPIELRSTVQSLLDSHSRVEEIFPNDSKHDNSDDRHPLTLATNEDQARLAGARLAARTAHHLLNTPLSLALGYGELLAEDPRLPDELRPMAREVVDSVVSAAALLHRLLGISRLEERDPDLPGGSILDLAKSVQGAPSGSN